MLLLLLACAHRGPVRADSGDTSPAQDTGEAACGPWAGVVRVGTRWTYAPSDAYVAAWGYDGTATVEIATIEGEVVTLVEEGAYSGDGGSFAWSRADTWRCDGESAWWTRSEAETEGTSGDEIIRSTGWRTFEPGWRVRPAAMEGWTDTFVVTASINEAAPSATDVTCSTAITGEADRDLQGTPIRAHQVTPTCEGVGADPMWLGEGIGLLETPDERLVAYAP